MDYSDNMSPEVSGGLMAILAGSMVIWVILLLIVIVSFWKIFEKAGEPGWAALIPIYNIIIMLKIVGRPIWWIVLLLIPFVNIIFGIILYLDLAKSFNKGTGFAVGLILLSIIFLPILAFDSSEYVGTKTQF
ncbi:MAG: hypothetical protein KGZ71_06445 [Desulfobulbaceae bacterium]|nr:hypothetical protein [Desulfobulbaceae bacterium]